MPAVETTTSPKPTLTHSGGRGTDHKLPTGGGGDGQWHEEPSDKRGPGERLKQARIGLALLLASSMGLFITLSAGYLWRRGTSVFDPALHVYVPVWKPIVVPPLLWWNTLLLVASSITLELARRQHFRDEFIMDEWLGLGRMTLLYSLPWEFLSLLLASGFVVGQLFAWEQLRRQGVFLNTGPSGQFYYFVTGLHGIHLLGGMLVLCWAILVSLFGRKLESRKVLIDITAWYWHAITVVWFGIFAVLKLCES
jgi:cytochrome c oxidase subunit 3